MKNSKELISPTIPELIEAFKLVVKDRKGIFKSKWVTSLDLLFKLLEINDNHHFLDIPKLLDEMQYKKIIVKRKGKDQYRLLKHENA